MRNSEIGEADLRHALAFWGAVAGMLVQGFFAFFRIAWPPALEDILDIFASLCIGGVVFLLVFTRYHKAAYRLATATLTAICTYTLLFPHHDTAASVMNFFVAPAIVFYLLGIREAAVWSVVLLIPVVLVSLFPQWLNKTDVCASLPAIAIVGLVSAVLFAFTLEHFRVGTKNILVRAQQELARATSQLTHLEGLVPICSYCKSVRDDKGYWRQLETYLAQHSGAVVSSGVCPTCAEENSGLIETDSFPVPAELNDMFSWRERIEKNRKKYLLFSTLLGIGFILGFAAADFIQAHWVGGWVQVFLALLFTGVVSYIYWASKSERAYTLLMPPLFVLMIHPFLYGSPDCSQLLWMFLFPQIAVALVGARWGAFWILLLFLFALFLFWGASSVGLPEVSYSLEMRMFFVSSFGFLGFFSIGLERIRAGYTERLLEQLKSLETTYADIRSFKGLVPVCSVCKSIRNDAGFWTRLDTYLLQHTDIRLTHGICTGCL
ncbi:MAG: hypothetical protein JXX29_21900, partial [Deltaproteobacteria bacterium]|nr:hypothetical protein [Deltaproteobacteria bacterium]